MTRDKPLITTVIPTYQRPKTLRRAIWSALRQDLKEVQVCVYDNASQDETPEVVRNIAEQDPRVVYVRHKEKVPALANFRFGLCRVATPFFSILSDDDWLLPNFYIVALDELVHTPGAQFFAGSTLHATEDGTVLSSSTERWQSGLYQPPEGLVGMWQNGHPTWTGIVFRRDVLGVADLGDGALADLDYELRLAKQCAFCVSREPVAVFSVHQGGVSSNFRLDQVWPGIREMGARDWNDPSIEVGWRSRIKECWKNAAGNMLLNVAAGALIRGEAKEARRAVALSRKECDRTGKAWLIMGLAMISGTGRIGQAAVRRSLQAYRRVRLVQRSVASAPVP